jgi:5-formyltetrahydrofolate cyclo-ligase
MTAQAGDTLELKAQLRQRLRQARRGLTPAQRRQAAARAARYLLRVLRGLRPRRIAVYLATGAELDCQPLIEAARAQGYSLYVPRLRPGGLHFVRLDPGTPLRRRRLGLLEPVRAVRLPVNRLAAVLLPLLGFDAAGQRLGQGGGHYDRALGPQRLRCRPRRIGYAYAVQQVARVPAAAWDVPLHCIVTDRGIQWPTG